MENKAQKTEGKTTKKSTKAATTYVSIRIPLALKNSAKKLREESNNQKKKGRKIRLDEIFALGVSLITKDDLKALQDKTLTHKDRLDLLRQKYVEMYGPISEDDFFGFTMTPQFQDFIKLQETQVRAA